MNSFRDCRAAPSAILVEIATVARLSWAVRPYISSLGKLLVTAYYILGQFVSLFPDLKLLVVARHCHHPLSRLGDGVRGPTESSPDSIESFSLRAGCRHAS